MPAAARGRPCARRAPGSTRWTRTTATGSPRFARFAAGERLRAERLPVEVLLERAISATGYDLEILGGAGGERRLANLRKLMRLAREYEGSEGRDLRGFLTYAAGQDLAEAREGEAALESEGLDAVRLMTIHRAKGLEFPVVCVADLGRPGVVARERLLIGPGASAGLRLATLAGGDPVPALGYAGIAERLTAAEAAEERRLLYVAATRAEERLILSGGIDVEKWPAPRPGGPVLDWLAPALLGDPAAALVAGEETVTGCGDGAVAVRLVTPATLPAEAAAPSPRARAAAPGTALPAAPKVAPAPLRPRPAQRRLSYSALRDYARCPYRFYLERVLGLPRVPAPPDPAAEPPGAAAEPGPAAEPAAVEPLEGRVRGTLVHVLLERLDFARPGRARRGGGARAGRRARRAAARRARARRAAARGRLRRLAAVRPACGRPPRAPRGGLRLRARPRRRRPAGPRLRRRPGRASRTGRC